jgi:hypothetical protein
MPPKGSGISKDIAEWHEERLLSEVLDSGPYVSTTVAGKNSKVYSLFFCWMPDGVNSEHTSEPSPVKTPSKASKKTTTKTIKQEKTTKKIKQKDLSKPLAAQGKRPRSLSSLELATLPKRPGATTRRRAEAVEQIGEGDESGEEEFRSVEEILKQKG